MIKFLQYLLAILSLIALFSFTKEKSIPFNSETTIKGYIENAEDSSEVSFSRFVNSNPEYYFLMYDDAEIINQRFEKTFDLIGTGVITIGPNKYFPKTYLICEGGNNININIDRNNNLLFKGSNAEGNQLFSERLRGRELDEYFKIFLLDKANSKNEAIKLIDSIKIQFLAPYSKLLESNAITNTFYITAKSQIRADFLKSLNNILTYHIQNPSKIKLSSTDMQELLQNIFSQNDPFSEEFRNIDLVSRTIIATKKCQLIDQGFLEGEPNDLGLWDYDKTENYYAPSELQEKMLAVNIMFNRYFQLPNIEADEKDFNRLKSVFPNSPYIIPLSKYFKKENKEFLKEYAYGIYKEGAKNIDFKKSLEDSNLENLIKTKIKGKPVLVDIWASWCAPCIKEFGYAETLRAFAESNNIEILYVSVDQPSASNLWKSNIVKNNLVGEHFLATENLYNYLKSTLKIENGIAIPKYMLSDSNGILLDSDLPRPSEETILYERVKGLLKQ